MIPCVIFEDEHLLVVGKPAGWNTHAPSPYSGEGIYEWLRHREPRWASLATIHRLDKETSGVLVFGKTPLANRSLTEQFAERRIRKSYVLLTDQPVASQSWEVKSRLTRSGSRYGSVPEGQTGGEPAETRFTVLSPSPQGTLVGAEPRTGRTHQIRVHAAESGIAVVGDTLYGGSAFQRLCLHAQSITLEHPESGAEQTFTVPVNFEAHGRHALRAAFVDHGETDAYRLIHGSADGWPGWYVDRLGGYLHSQAEGEPKSEQLAELRRLLTATGARGAYHKLLSRHVRRRTPQAASARLVMGEAAPNRFVVRENGLSFELGFSEGYSVGLFLDQRDNRRRLLTGHVAAGLSVRTSASGDRRLQILNAFSYTCGFSVCLAKSGACVTSLDLSRKNLDWGRKNFELNGIDPAGHDFIYGDAFDWMKRLLKKGRCFDVVVVDPPTFSQSKRGGIFRAERDYGDLTKAAVSLLQPGGLLLASTNAANWAPEAFLQTIRDAIDQSGRSVAREQLHPQPPDFPVTHDEPAYLKTAWWRLA